MSILNVTPAQRTASYSTMGTLESQANTKLPPVLDVEVIAQPSMELVITNRLTCYPSDFYHGAHVLVNEKYYATVQHDNTGRMGSGQIAVSAAHRNWMGVKEGGRVRVSITPYPPHPAAPLCLTYIKVEIGLRPSTKDGQIKEDFSFDHANLSNTFLQAFNGIIMSFGVPVMLRYDEKPLIGKVTFLSVDPKQCPDLCKVGDGATGKDHGILKETTTVEFLKASSSLIRPKKPITARNFKFEDMGKLVGGLDTEVSEIFRRAFASRAYSPALVKKLGIQHVKGIILHGPPGTGKTLMARQIGKTLEAQRTKIVNGPEILNKYVGASEEKIRELFSDAEKEYKEKGDESGLHIIIFDELDAICKRRGSTNNGSGVGDSVVNQLLAKTDGVEQLNNLLIIGTTNRIDMIDEALLRPGRFEVHMEVSLPDKNGRLQILNIHTQQMRDHKLMDDDVNLNSLVGLTKNFSGAEISGLIRGATSFAFHRHEKDITEPMTDEKSFKVKNEDFMNALREVRPAFGVEDELSQIVPKRLILFDKAIEEILEYGKCLVTQLQESAQTSLVSILLYGPQGSGKTALAGSIVQASQYPFIKLISPDRMVGFTETQKVQAITKTFSDSYRSPLSIIVVDNIERLIDWVPLGERFSNPVLQTLLVSCSRRPPKGHQLLILATSSLHREMRTVGLTAVFDSELYVPPITTLNGLYCVLREKGLKDKAIRSFTTEAGFGANGGKNIAIGMRKLLSTIEMMRQAPPKSVVKRLLNALTM